MTDKIYCANCLHCKLFHAPPKTGKTFQRGLYYKRIKCTAGNWFTSKGVEKIRKFYTIARKTVDDCGQYISMSDNGEKVEEWIDFLDSQLPSKDIVYRREEERI